MTRYLLVAAVAIGLVGSAPAAAATTSSFEGSCQLSGPIKPKPPITLLPHDMAHFDYDGTGTCDGKLDGASLKATPVTLSFRDASTLFDTCELGPDFGLRGVLRIATRTGTSLFDITINLARVAIVGPFSLTTDGGGQALGTAQFAPKDPAGAVQQCAASGVADASLSASFSTSSALVGRRAVAARRRC